MTDVVIRRVAAYVGAREDGSGSGGNGVSFWVSFLREIGGEFCFIAIPSPTMSDQHFQSARKWRKTAPTGGAGAVTNDGGIAAHRRGYLGS